MFAIACTDNNWYNFLKENELYSEINFWTPTSWNISKLQVGDKIFFMLKSPIRKIAGYGVFKEYFNSDVETSWNRFGYGNGFFRKNDFIGIVNNYKKKI